VQHEAQLDRGGPAARFVTGCQVLLPGFDMVRGLTALTVDVFVEVARADDGDAGDYKARVRTERPGLGAGDDMLDARPSAGTVEERVVATELTVAWSSGVAGLGVLLERQEVPAQRRGGDNAEGEVNAGLASEVQHLGHTETAVGVQQGLNAWPMTVDLADRAEHEGACLYAAWAAGRAEHGPDGRTSPWNTTCGWKP
jgi:hypothetical protein